MLAIAASLVAAIIGAITGGLFWAAHRMAVGDVSGYRDRYDVYYALSIADELTTHDLGGHS